jgi:hypothetical protein
MKQIYLILLLCILPLIGSAQDTKSKGEPTIEGLSFYPNPVSNGKLYISTKNSLTKEISIFDVLGKEVLNTTINSKELNVSALNPGIYIIKIKEGEATATRKLVIK